MQQERRSAQRVRVYLPMQIHAPGAGHPVETLTKDVSSAGLRCVSPSITPVSTEVGLDVVLSAGADQLSVRGKTIWFRTIPDSEQFDLGIAFVGLSDQDQRRLSAYIDHLSTKSIPAVV